MPVINNISAPMRRRRQMCWVIRIEWYRPHQLTIRTANHAWHLGARIKSSHGGRGDAFGRRGVAQGARTSMGVHPAVGAAKACRIQACVLHGNYRSVRRLTDDGASAASPLTTELRQLGLSSVSEAHTGLVTFVQRSDSALRLNVHFHTLALDGVYVRNAAKELEFQTLAPPSAGELRALSSLGQRPRCREWRQWWRSRRRCGAGARAPVSETCV